VQVSEGILGLARKCMQLKAPEENDPLSELLLGILGENTQVYMRLYNVLRYVYAYCSCKKIFVCSMADAWDIFVA
jgi:hypothetical protein